MTWEGATPHSTSFLYLSPQQQVGQNHLPPPPPPPPPHHSHHSPDLHHHYYSYPSPALGQYQYPLQLIINQQQKQEQLQEQLQQQRQLQETILRHLSGAAISNTSNLTTATVTTATTTNSSSMAIRSLVTSTLDMPLLGYLNVTVGLVFIIAFLLTAYLYSCVRRPKGLPPGPSGLPILGVIPLMGKRPYLTIQKWWGMYGDVYSMYMGSRLVIVLNGIEIMKECLVKQGDKFSARPWNYFKKLTKNTGK